MSDGVSAAFSEDLDPDTVAPDVVTLVVEATGMPVAGAVSYDPSSRRVVFTPESDLSPFVTYRAELAGGVLADRAGNRMADTLVWRFTTAGPVPAPVAPAPAPEPPGLEEPKPPEAPEPPAAPAAP